MVEVVEVTLYDGRDRMEVWSHCWQGDDVEGDMEDLEVEEDFPRHPPGWKEQTEDPEIFYLLSGRQPPLSSRCAQLSGRR